MSRGKWKNKDTKLKKKIRTDMQNVSLNKIFQQQLQGVTFIEYENIKKPIKTKDNEQMGHNQLLH